MATVYSDNLARTRAGRNNPANFQAGKVRIQVWDFASLPVGNIGDVLVCFKLEKDERLILGREFHSALGGTATGAYGTYLVGTDGVTLGAVDDIDRFLAATTHVAAGQNNIADLQALGIGINSTAVAQGVLYDNQSVDVLVCCTNAGSAFATAGRITGWALVVKD